jgi:hypothetical protein
MLKRTLPPLPLRRHVHLSRPVRTNALKRLATLLLLAPLLLCAPPGALAQQGRAQAARTFAGNWNWATYAESKEDLPPAYQSMRVKEVPVHALDLTIRQKGSRVTAACGLLFHYLSKVDECDFSAVVRNGSALVNLKSSFGGTATVRLTFQGDALRWRVVRSRGENYYPRDVTLRRLRKGEKLPYASDEGEDEQ